MRVELRPGDHGGFERWARAHSTPQWRMERAQTGSAEKVGILMLAVRRRQDLLGLEDWSPRVRRRDRESGRKPRRDPALDAGEAGRQGDAVRGAECRHRLGDPTSVCRMSATWRSSRSCAPSNRTGPEFDLRVIRTDYLVPTGAEVKPWVAKHSEITSHFVPTLASWSTSSNATTDSPRTRTQPHRLGDLRCPPNGAAPTLRTDGPACPNRRRLKRPGPS